MEETERAKLRDTGELKQMIYVTIPPLQRS